MENRTVHRIAALVTDLPALPAVAQEALALLSRPDVLPEDLQEVLSRDPALSLRILRLANSAFYRRNREITTLTSAILLMGFKTIHTLILSSAVHKMLAHSGNIASVLWEHSFAAGVACREARRQTRSGGDDAEAAFLVGLFHDIAKGVIVEKFPGVYGRAIGIDGELELLGFHHGQLAQILLSKWNIPQLLVTAVGCHHQPEKDGLGQLAAIADWLAWEVAPGVGAPKPPCPDASLNAQGLDGKDVEAVLRRLEANLAEERAAHGQA